MTKFEMHCHKEYGSLLVFQIRIALLFLYINGIILRNSAMHHVNS